ncbi:hypothetical protein [Ornithinimicrobium sp. LYQ103]|uniref:hypothetical protein n=1 Tax=Ornithinimicrobium sp. LYQ103 TaxID=3378796 RepID=UPI0038525ADC
MKRSTVNHSTRVPAYSGRVRDELLARYERGSISVETVVIALGLFALATLVVSLLTAWATGRLGGLS